MTEVSGTTLQLQYLKSLSVPDDKLFIFKVILR